MFVCCGVGEVSVHAMCMCGGQRTTSKSEGFSPLPRGLQGSNVGHQICQQVSSIAEPSRLPKHPAFPGQENLEAVCPQTLFIPNSFSRKLSGGHKWSVESSAEL